MAESENSTVLWGIRESSTSVSPSVWPTVDGPLGLHSDEALKYAKGFYYGGFAMLPWLWFVSCFYFWPILVHRQSDTEIRQYVVKSGIGFVICTIVLLSWAITFAKGGQQLFGSIWGHLAVYDVADRLELNGTF